jgi:hypothetical protein
MLKKKWIASAVVALGLVAGFAQAKSPSPAAPVAAIDGCSHAGGACSWSGDCCMNENLGCDNKVCTAH